MAKAGHTFHLQRFFIIFGALFSIAALGIIVFASQKQTNTQSDASGGKCNMTPQIRLINSEAEKDAVGKIYGRNYSIRVWNDSKISCKQKLSYVSYKFDESAPLGWFYSYENHRSISADTSIDDLVPQEKHTLKLYIQPGKNFKKGSYSLPFKVCRTVPDCKLYNCTTNSDDKWSAYYYGRTGNCSSIKLDFNVN